MPETLFIEFRPRTVAWIGDLQTRTSKSSSPLVRARYRSWAECGLGELAIAIATRLAIVHRVENQLRESVTLLKDEVRKSDDLDELLKRSAAFRPSDEDLPYDICAAVDACFFEWRSLYELVGKFATVFSREILGKPVTESQLQGVVESADVPIPWINSLRGDRNLFSHQTAPWIGLKVATRKPFAASLVVMKENLSTLDDPETYVSEAEFLAVSKNLRYSLIVVREWLKESLQAVEAENAKGTG